MKRKLLSALLACLMLGIPALPSCVSSYANDETLEQLDEETAILIRQDYLDNLIERVSYTGILNDVYLYKYFGTYNNCIVVIMGGGLLRNYGLTFPKIREVVIGKTTYLYHTQTMDGILVWEDGTFYELQDAYNIKMLKKDDVKKIMNFCDMTSDYKEDRVLIALKNEYSVPNTEITLEHFSEVSKVVELVSVREMMPYSNDNPRDPSTHCKLLEIKLAKPSKQNVLKALEELEKLEMIKYAEPDYINQAASPVPPYVY